MTGYVLEARRSLAETTKGPTMDTAMSGKIEKGVSSSGIRNVCTPLALARPSYMATTYESEAPRRHRHRKPPSTRLFFRLRTMTRDSVHGDTTEGSTAEMNFRLTNSATFRAKLET